MTQLTCKAWSLPAHALVAFVTVAACSTPPLRKRLPMTTGAAPPVLAGNLERKDCTKCALTAVAASVVAMHRLPCEWQSDEESERRSVEAGEEELRASLLIAALLRHGAGADASSSAGS